MDSQMNEDIEKLRNALHESEEKRSILQKQLNDSQMRFRETADYIPGILCEFNTDLTLTYVNRTGLQIFYYTLEDLKKGITVTKIVHPDDLPKMYRDIENILKGDFGNAQHYRFFRNDGEIIHLLINTTPVYKESVHAGFRSYIIDITEREKTSQMLRESEDRFRGVFAASPIGIALFGANGRLNDMNKSFRTMFNIPSEIPAQSIRFSITEIDGMKEQIQKLKQGQGFQIESDHEITFIITPAIKYS
jgi:PAS domain S-box-containing protein